MAAWCIRHLNISLLAAISEWHPCIFCHLGCTTQDNPGRNTRNSAIGGNVPRNDFSSRFRSGVSRSLNRHDPTPQEGGLERPQNTCATKQKATIASPGSGPVIVMNDHDTCLLFRRWLDDFCYTSNKRFQRNIIWLRARFWHFIQSKLLRHLVFGAGDIARQLCNTSYSFYRV